MRSSLGVVLSNDRTPSARDSGAVQGRVGDSPEQAAGTRVLGNLAANAVTTAIITVFQIVSVPVFLHYWGISRYGEWIALSTLAAYFQISDVGLNTATANELTFAYARGEVKRCDVLLTNSTIFVVAVFGGVLLLLLLAERAGVVSAVVRFEEHSAATVRIVVLLLLGQVFVGTLSNSISGIYRATGKTSRGLMFDNGVRFAEYATMLLGVIGGAEITLILVLVIAVKGIGLLLKAADARRLIPFRISIDQFSSRELRQTIAPGFFFFLLPLSNAVSLQAPVALVSVYLGSAAVVVFTTVRTLVGFARSVIDIVHRSVWPEVSLAFGHHDLSTLRHLHRHVLAVTLVIVAVAAVGFAVAGEWIYSLWTGGETRFDGVLCAGFVVAFGANALWSASGVLLQATNQHRQLALLQLAGAGVVLGVTFALLRFDERLSLLSFALVLSDGLMLSFVMRSALRLTESSWRSLLPTWSWSRAR